MIFKILNPVIFNWIFYLVNILRIFYHKYIIEEISMIHAVTEIIFKNKKTKGNINWKNTKKNITK